MEQLENDKGFRFLRIQSIQDLDWCLRNSMAERTEFFIALNFGLRSTKSIRKCRNGHYEVFNSIDGSRRFVTAEQLTSPLETNIGAAILKGAFFHQVTSSDRLIGPRKVCPKHTEGRAHVRSKSR